MTRTVLDASVVLARRFEDERAGHADHVRDRLITELATLDARLRAAAHKSRVATAFGP